MNEQETQITPTVDLPPGTLVAQDVFAGDTYTADPAAKNSLSTEEKKALLALVRVCSNVDPTARRIQVIECWKARWFQRGYQRLLNRPGGGFCLPGIESRFNAGEFGRFGTDNGIINVYSRDHDIVVSILSSEVPGVRFFPHNTSKDVDITAADSANSYRYWFNTSNCLDKKLGEIASFFYTDGIAVTFTRSVASSRFGFIDSDDIDPVEPETESLELPEISTKIPRIREVVNVYGALETKVPSNAQSIEEMNFVQFYVECDVATAKALYPFIAHKIQAGPSNADQLELDRIARLNIKMNMGTGWTTGDTLERQVALQKTFIRPSLFMDDAAKSVRESLLQKFPDGALIECAGTEFAQATALSMDDHLCILHSNPGAGQNRRSLGNSVISLQERLNRLSDLMMDFFTRTIPNRYMDSEAFDLQLLAQQSNVPGATLPFMRQPGVPFSELLGTDPIIQANPQMLEFMELLQGTWSQDLTGALPSLIGSGNSNTVGNAVIQSNNGKQRFSYPWKIIKNAVACITKQAVQSAAYNNNDAISDAVRGVGRISVEMQDLRGNVLCYPDSDSNLPESWAQRQGIFLEAVQQAPQNPFLQNLISLPGNARAIKDAIGLTTLDIPGAASSEKQIAELELLQKNGPVPNPDLQTIQTEISKIQAELAHFTVLGIQPPPGAPEAIQQLQQQAQSLPRLVSTVPVMQDASEEHAVEASICQAWLISPDGLTMKNGDELQRAGWQNVWVHWAEHTAMAQKLNPPSPPPIKVNGNVAIDKLTPDVQAAVFKDLGINIDPNSFQQQTPHEITQETTQPTIGGGSVSQKVALKGQSLN